MPVTRSLLFGFSFVLAAASFASGQSAEPVGYWDSRFDHEDVGGQGANAYTLDAAVHPLTGDVYVGGSFTGAGDVNTFRIGRWNGSEWSSVGGGLRGEVRGLAFAPDGRLFAVGHFIVAEQTDGSQIEAKYVAEWDGSSWSSLGRGLSGRASAVAFDAANGYLYVGGSFDTAINADSSVVESAKVAFWDGSNWQPMGLGLAATFSQGVSTIAVDATGDRVLVGGPRIAGVFNADGTEVDAAGLAQWDGSSWSNIGSPDANLGIDQVVFDASGQIYVGGKFSSFEGVDAMRLVRHNGTEWESLGAGVGNGAIYTIRPAEDGVFVGGNFSEVQQPDGSILKVGAIAYLSFDTGRWSPLQDGLRSSHFLSSQAIVNDGDDLFVAGRFQSAGGRPSNYVARWIRSERPFATTPVQFNLDTRPIDRFGMVAGSWTPRPMLEVLTGELSGIYYLHDIDNDGIESITIDQPAGEVIDYVYFIDRTGQGWDNNHAFVHELDAPLSTRKFAVPSAVGTVAPPTAIFDDRDPIGPPLNPTNDGIAWLWEGRSSQILGGSSSHRVRATIDKTDRNVFISMAEEEASPEGILPDGILPDGIQQVSKDILFRLEVWPAASDYEMTFDWAYDNITGIDDPSDLKMLHRPHPNSAWKVIPTEVVVNNELLRTPGIAKASGEWTIGSISLENVLTDFLPPEPANPIPGDGALSAPIGPTLRWDPSREATSYNVFLWLASESEPTSPIARVKEASYETAFLTDGSTYSWRVVAVNVNGTTPGPVWTFQVGDVPDLEVTSLDTPVEAFSGQPVEVSWTVTNSGDGGTNAPRWDDLIFLAPTDNFDLESAVLLGGFPNRTSLKPGESYTNRQSIDLPRGIEGPRYIHVLTDARLIGSPSRFDESGLLDEIDETNNAAVSPPVGVTLSPYADLEVIDVVATDLVFSGDSIDVTWTVGNVGTGQTDVDNWFDTIFLSDDKEFNFFFSGVVGITRIDESSLGSFEHTGALEAGGTYSLTRRIGLPEDAIGDLYLFVYTDIRGGGKQPQDGDVYEFIQHFDNWTEEAITITLTPPPDLTVTQVSGPESAKSGQPVQLSWTVENQGPGLTPVEKWADIIYFSPTESFDSQTAVSLKSFTHIGALANDASYTDTATVRVPNGVSGPGFFFVVTDGRGIVFEHTFEDNNLAANPLSAQIVPGPYPDLHVTDVQTGRMAIEAGREISVTYRIQNDGDAAVADTWVDSVFVLDKPVWDRFEAEPLLGIRRRHAMEPGEDLTATVAITVPTHYSGPFYVFVQTDALDSVFEQPDDQANLGRSNVVTAADFPAPDLAAALLGLADSTSSGEDLPLRAAVTNRGLGRTLIDSWTDAVYLSPDNSLDTDSDELLAEFLHEGGLAAGLDYDYDRSVRIPNGIEGPHFVILQADSKGQSAESSRNNNVSVSPLNVLATPPADLQITDVDLADGAHSGQRTALSWKTSNAGTGPTPANNWFDAVFLSLDRTLDHRDLLLSTFEHTAPLAASETRLVDVQIAMPAYAAGPYYLIVQTDHRDEVYEQLAEANNLAFEIIELELAEPSDLVVEGVVIPSEASPGDSVTVSWTIRNAGPNPARGLMREAVVISSDETVDLDDPLLGVLEAEIDLGPGESAQMGMKVDFTQTVQIDTSGVVTRTLPGVLPGNYFAIVRTDVGNSMRETDDDNNSASSPSTIGIFIPELTLGTPASINLAEGQATYFRLTADANSDLRFTLRSTNQSAGNEIYAAFERPPSAAGNYDFAADEPFLADQELVIPSTMAGTYYVVVQARNSPGAPSQEITLLAEAMEFSVTSISPSRVGQSRVTATIDGAGFRGTDRIFLSNNAGLVVEAAVIDFRSTTSVSIRLQGITPIGTYDVVVERSGGEQVTLEDGIEVETDLNVALDTRVIGPDRIRADGAATFRIEVSNPSNVDVPYVFLSMRSSASENVQVFTDLFAISDGIIPGTPEEYVRDFIRAEDGSSIIPAIGRDLGPGGTVAVKLEFSGFYAATFDLMAEASALTEDQAVEAFRTSAELTRLEALAIRQPTAPVPDLTDDSEHFESTMMFNLYELGLVDAHALEGGSGRAATKGAGVLSTTDSTCPCVDWASSGSSSIQGECIRRQCPEPYPDLPPDDPDPDPDDPSPPAISCDDQIGEQAQCFERWENRCRSPGTCVARAVLCAAGGAKLGWAGAGGGAVVCWLSCVVTVAATEICDPNWTISVPRVICPDVDASCDPNDIIGPDGFSDDRWIAGDQVLPYKIRFENDPVRASASAQVVGITHPLDPSTDPRSFRLGSFGFGSFSFDPPENTSYYRERIDVSDSLGVAVDVTAGIDVVKNEAFWRFTSIDPVTGDQPINDPGAGFLPVNDESGIGEGFVSYTVISNPAASTGDVIDAQADIVFDINPPLLTPAIFNTIDADPPVSGVNVIGDRRDSVAFEINWTGRDEGSGIREYTLYSSLDGGEFRPVQTGVSDTTHLFVGELGHRYQFFTIATDNAGNREPIKTKGESGTIVSVEEDEPAGIPKEFALHQNYPNPFNPTTAIPFDLPESGTVELVVYDIMGRQVLSVNKGELRPGMYQHLLDMSRYASGVYLYQVRVTGQTSLLFSDVGKLVLVK